MKEFRFEEFDDCKFIVERYPNRNLKISIMSRTNGIICFVTCGIDKRLEDDTIAVKTIQKIKAWILGCVIMDILKIFHAHTLLRSL